MPIKILQVARADYNAADAAAHDTAEKWINRIQDLFLTERSYQTQIGISEVGSDCRKCVARKLAGKPKKPEGSWFPFIGTAVHSALEEGFGRWEFDYHLENRLQVWQYGDFVLGGSCDMAAIVEGKTLVVNDWKVVGDTALTDAAKGKIKNQYRIQAMLYGLGWKNKGYDVSHVALTFLPRNQNLDQAQVVMLRYDEMVAAEALAALAVMIDAAEVIGWEEVIAKQPKASFCWDCKKFEQEEYGDVSSLI
jgi:hypothetical protein